ncbi:hypothetical protein [Paenibacillus amylolyticus]|uniref:hypothetical protein n=1 Tax=Paenibacillus amylolyticus TaxID=1451 RepID=UPI000B899A97|nr:hypothetical protein [Paenibacillus amylolyticus]
MSIEKLEQLRYELNTEKQRGALADSNKISEIEQQINEIENETAVSTVTYVLDNLNVHGTQVREFFLNNKEETAAMSYEVVRDAVQALILEREQYWKEQNDQIQAQFELERSAREEAQASETRAGEANAQMVVELRNTRMELEDVVSKRDAAVTQLEEKNAEIDRLSKEVDGLRKQLSANTVVAPKEIDTGDSYARWKEQKQREEEAKPAIYDVEWADDKRSTYRAKLAATDEVITFNYLEKGKYREVSAEEALQFRINTQESEHRDEDLARTNDVEESSELTPPWGYPEEDTAEITTNGLAEEQLAGSSAEETEGTVTRAEFEELKRRVSALELPQSEVA